MVSKRDNLWVLTMHAGIHFVVMIILVGQVRGAIWPYLLLISTIHLAQDRIKNSIVKKRPDWTGTGFVIDQFTHFVIIWAFVLWLQNVAGFIFTPEKPVGIMVFITYLFVTIVWYIIERIFNLSNPEYLENISNTKYPRMLSRAGLVSLFILFWSWRGPGLALIISNPYPQSRFRQRTILTDVSISLLAMIFLIWTFR